MSSDFSQWTWAAEEGEYRCPGGMFECNPSKAACTLDTKSSRRFCCDYGGVCWTEGTRCGGPDTFLIQREDEDPFCCIKDRERPDPGRGGACLSTLDNPLIEISAKELQDAYSRALEAGVDPTDAPSFDPFDLNPEPAPETTSSSKKTPSKTSTPKQTPVEPTPDSGDEETSSSTPATTTSSTPSETSGSHFQGGQPDDEDDDKDAQKKMSSGTFDLTTPLATGTSSSGYLGGNSDSATENASNNGLSTGALAGIIVASVIGGLLIAVGIFFLVRRKKQQNRALHGGGPSNPSNPNDPLEVMGVTLLFKKPRHQPIVFGTDADSATDVAAMSRTSQSPLTEMTDSSRTELNAAIPVEAQSAPVVELSASRSQRWRNS